MKKIVIAGVGALGSHVALLIRSLPAQIRIVDFDRVEQKNTSSQFHGRTGVGKSKVVALAQTMDMLFKVRLEQNSNRITKDNVAVILGGQDLVLDCLDNGESRRIIQDFVRASSIPCLHGALAADGGFGQIIWDDRFVVDDEPETGAATCEGGEHLPFIAMVSAFMARSVQIFLKDGIKTNFQIHPKGGMVV